MNYSQLEKYLQDKVFNTNDNKVVNFKPEFLTANNLTESPELLNSFTKFYESLTATVNEDENYHQLKGYLRKKDDFLKEKPHLGKKDETSRISNKHYQLINETIIDFNWESLQNHSEAVNLYNRASKIKERFEQLIHNGLITTSENIVENKIEPLIVKIVAKHPDKQKIFNDCFKWIKDFDSWKEKHRKENIGLMFLLRQNKEIRDICEKTWTCQKEVNATKYNQEKLKFGLACLGFFALLTLMLAYLKSKKKNSTPKLATKQELLKYKRQFYITLLSSTVFFGITSIVAYVWNEHLLAVLAYATIFFFTAILFYGKEIWEKKLKEIEAKDQEVL